MHKETVIAHFGTAVAVAQALEISHQAVCKWDEIIPEGVAYKLQVITGGKLQVDPSIYRQRKAAARH